jgi:hypothetical protein
MSLASCERSHLLAYFLLLLQMNAFIPICYSGIMIGSKMPFLFAQIRGSRMRGWCQFMEAALVFFS